MSEILNLRRIVAFAESINDVGSHLVFLAIKDRETIANTRVFFAVDYR